MLGEGQKGRAAQQIRMHGRVCAVQLGSGGKRLVRDACVLRGEEMIPEE